MAKEKDPTETNTEEAEGISAGPEEEKEPSGIPHWAGGEISKKSQYPPPPQILQTWRFLCPKNHISEKHECVKILVFRATSDACHFRVAVASFAISHTSATRKKWGKEGGGDKKKTRAPPFLPFSSLCVLPPFLPSSFPHFLLLMRRRRRRRRRRVMR